MAVFFVIKKALLAYVDAITNVLNGKIVWLFFLIQRKVQIIISIYLIIFFNEK